MDKIGEGGEAEVFALDADRVLRRFRASHPSIARRVAFTAEIAAGAAALDFAVPEILDHYVDDDGRPCFVERRLAGRSMTESLRQVTGSQRTALLTSYLETAMLLREIEFDRPLFGEIIADDPLLSPTWREYLRSSLDRQVSTIDRSAYPELPDLDETADRLRTELADLPEPSPSVVHFDYFPGNVLCDDTRITAVIDWSVVSIFGDPDLDPSLAVSYFGVTPTATAEDMTFGRLWLAERGLADRAATYEQWAAAWWAPFHQDPQLRSWAASVLRQPSFGPEL